MHNFKQPTWHPLMGISDGRYRAASGPSIGGIASAR